VSRVLLHDSGRSGKVGWAETAIRGRMAAGVVISPWQTPPTDMPRRPSAATYRDVVRDAGGTVIWDPTTAGAHAPGSNDRDIYDLWSLWQPPGDPAVSDVALQDHVDRCAQHAHGLGVELLGPTIALDSPQGQNAERAEDMAEQTLAALPGSGITIAGTQGFWTSGTPLDAYIGRLISLRPARVNVVLVRPGIVYPPAGLTAAEVGGLCRSVHTLSLHSQVVVGHGDYAALPAVVAGAALVGSGWDLRHRVFALDAFTNTTQGGGGTPPRVTHAGLLGVLKRADAESLLAADAPRSAALVPGSLPVGINGAWQHHLECLNAAVETLSAATTRSARATLLEGWYAAADAEFAQVDGLVGGLDTGAVEWIHALRGGLALYVAEEGL